jgi:DNA mismatch endonuclease (patch repair protein)
MCNTCYQNAYSQLPKRKKHLQAYRKRPKVKARQKAYRQRPEIKAQHKAYMKLYKTIGWKGKHNPNISKALKKIYKETPEIYINPARVEKLRIARLHQIFPKEDTGIERYLQAELNRRHISFVKHLAEVGQPDIAFPNEKIVVFADGDYWHGGNKYYPTIKKHMRVEKNIERALRTNAQLHAEGWKVLRFWEHEIKADVEKCVDEIEIALHKKENFLDKFGGD